MVISWRPVNRYGSFKDQVATLYEGDHTCTDLVRALLECWQNSVTY